MIFETKEQRDARIKQDKMETAEYLRGLLERTVKMLGLLSPKVWHSSSDTVHTVAYTLEKNGFLSTAKDVISYFEKPWKYEKAMQDLANVLESETRALV